MWCLKKQEYLYLAVAPLLGAWIEIVTMRIDRFQTESRSLIGSAGIMSKNGQIKSKSISYRAYDCCPLHMVNDKLPLHHENREMV